MNAPSCCSNANFSSSSHTIRSNESKSRKAITRNYHPFMTNYDLTTETIIQTILITKLIFLSRQHCAQKLKNTNLNPNCYVKAGALKKCSFERNIPKQQSIGPSKVVPIQRSDPQQGSIGFIRLYIHRGSVQRLCWVLQGLELKFHGKVLCERLPLPLFVKVRWRL